MYVFAYCGEIDLLRPLAWQELSDADLSVDEDTGAVTKPTELVQPRLEVNVDSDDSSEFEELEDEDIMLLNEQLCHQVGLLICNLSSVFVCSCVWRVK